MMQLDHRIILGGQQVNPLAAILEGQRARAEQGKYQQDNALRQFMTARGGDVFRGDTNALAALAGLDPDAAMRINGQHTAARYQAQDRAMQAEQFGWARQDRGAAQQRDAEMRGLLGQAFGIKDSLARTESGGNYSAQNADGYTGRYQFGQDRLDDFARANGIGRISMEAFKNNPALQEKVMDWHVGDINSFIDKRGLAQYEGQSVGGVPMTRDGMVAMAHLGGKGGLARFLQTGGRYDPADSNRTRLSDYARTHASAGGQQQYDPQALMAVIASPDAPAQAREMAGTLLAQQAETPAPMTDAGKLTADLRAGHITQDQYNAAAGPGLDVKGESDLRKEFSALPVVKTFSEQTQALTRLKASTADPSPAGDLAVIFNYMKMLDPGSTVREGEFATAQNAGAIDDRVYGIYNRVLEGTRLAPDQRADFVGRAQKIYAAAEQQFMPIFKEYQGIAQTYGYDPARSVADFRYRQPPEMQGPPVAPAAPRVMAYDPATGEWTQQ